MGTHFTRINHHEERTVLSEVVFMKNLKELIILHSNDMHGDFLAEQIDEKLVGGVSLLSGYVNMVRNQEKNVLYAIAGDMFRGSVIDSEYKGVSTIGIMNLLGPDVKTSNLCTLILPLMLL